MRSIVLSAYAKINWRLAVTGRRADGYHCLHGLMQSISLCDSVRISESERDECFVHPAVPGLLMADNLAYRAWQLLKQQAGLPNHCRIEIEKNIPAGAGLAGGSTDAAALLHSANQLFKLGLSLAELQTLGLQLGADLPFCLQGGLALASGVGEVLTALPEPPLLQLLLACGETQLPTAHVFAEYRRSGQAFSSLAAEEQLAGELAAALAAGDIAAIESLLANDLEAPAVALQPQIGRIKALFAAAGLRPLMSGSGDSVFALCADAASAAAALKKLQGQIPWLRIVQTQRISQSMTI